MKTDNLILPDFLGIGAQKAGTTWLHANLKAHPEAFMPEEKELHFFDRNLESGIARYADNFSRGENMICGEITPAYGILPAESIEFIHALIPEAKIIFILRNPIERAWAHAVMDLVTAPRRPADTVRDDEYIRHATSPASLMRGDYESILKRWSAIYPENQIYVSHYEQIARNPCQFLEGIFNFIGLSADVDWSTMPYDQIIHQGTKVRMPRAVDKMLREIYPQALGSLSPLPSWMRDNEDPKPAASQEPLFNTCHANDDAL